MTNIRLLLIPATLLSLVACGEGEDSSEIESSYNSGYYDGVASVCTALRREHPTVYERVDRDIGC